MGSHKLWESRGHGPFRVSGHTAEASFRRLRQAVLSAVLSLAALSGCGGKDSSRTLGIGGYVYVPQQVELSGMSLENFQIVDGYIYYRSGDYDSGTDVRRFPAEELLSQETPVLPSGESLFGADNPTEHIQDFTVSPDGCLYYLEYRSSPGETSALRLSEPELPEEGTESVEMKIHIRIPDGADESYTGMDREELDAVFAVIGAADYTPVREKEEQVIDIILEEMSPCLTGAKTYQEAAAIVQNRLRNLVQEEGSND